MPAKNVQYSRVSKTAMEERGHLVEHVFASYNATILALSKIIVEEENHQRKSEGLLHFTSIERKAFLLK